MRKTALAIVILLAFLFSLCGCNLPPVPNSNIGTVPANTESVPATTHAAEPSTDDSATAEPTELTEPEPSHSPLYIEGLAVEDVILYFNEVCLDAEFINSGDASLIQKWAVPIYYQINGDPTREDLAVLGNFTAWLNTIDGFPGIHETQDALQANLRIHFCSQPDMLTLMGDNFTNMDGAITFWYEDNAIYDAIICYRTDLTQSLRNSVILEEIYNGLGPIQDTQRRPDSIIYSEFSEPQSLTAIDELILQLLYHPEIRCGMSVAECEQVIRQLYY